jgi:cytochrome P450
MDQSNVSKLNYLSLRRQYTNPYRLYDTLREHDQLYFDATSQCWLVTGYEMATTILDDKRFISESSLAGKDSSQMASIGRQMLFLNGEVHRRAQDVVLKPLALMVKQLPAEIRKFARNALEAARGKGEIDVVSEFAAPISLLTIAHVLGIPADDWQELQQLERWSDTFGDVTSGYFIRDKQDITNLENYFRRLIAHKRRVPADDLLSTLINAKDIFPDEEDLIANCMMVFAAGRITTKKLLGNGISLLLPDWEQHQAELQKNSYSAKWLGEELLRMVTPTRYLIREASEDVDFSSFFSGNHLVRRGQRVLLFLEAADYDPAIFSQPGQFNPHRRPNKHIAFGYGPHQCPGATLARVEIHIALEEILSLSRLHLHPEMHPIWNPNPNLGGFTANPMVFEAAL